MYRGTTPSLKLTLDTTLDLTKLKQVWVTLKNTKVEITKELDDVEISQEDKAIYINLTQEETLELSPGTTAVQVRLLMNDDKAYATDKQNIEVYGLLKGGVISE